MTAYRYPDDGPDPAVEIERLRRAWHAARTNRDLRLRDFYNAVRDELLAEAAFRAVVADETAETVTP